MFGYFFNCTNLTFLKLEIIRNKKHNCFTYRKDLNAVIAAQPGELEYQSPNVYAQSIMLIVTPYTDFCWISTGYAVELEGPTLVIPNFLSFLDSGGRAGIILLLMVLLIIQRIGAATPPPKRPPVRKRKVEREKAEKDGGDIACNCKKNKPRGVLPWLIKFFTS